MAIASLTGFELDRQASAHAGNDGTRRSGVALVMVLGLVVVLVIMAVTFATIMRTERVAAANAVDNIRVRQLIQVALVRAVDDMANRLTNEVYPPWSAATSKTIDEPFALAHGLRWPEFTGPIRLIRGQFTTNGLLYGEATNYVPRALWDAAIAASTGKVELLDAKGSNGFFAGAHWVPIMMPGLTITNVFTNTYGSYKIVGTSISSRAAGRVAYLAVNCSGLLDANFAGANGVSRRYGTNSSEIQLDKLPEVASASTFYSIRENNTRFETLAELAELTIPSALSGFPSNLFIYSYAPAGYCTNFDADLNDRVIGGQPDQAWIGGKVEDLNMRRTQITGMFVTSGIAPDEATAAMLFTNLIDYVDDNSIPLNLAYPTVEAVPLINEVAYTLGWSSRSLGSGTNCLYLTNLVTIELWNPFCTNVPNAYLQATVGFGAAPNPLAIGQATIGAAVTSIPAGQYWCYTMTNKVAFTNPPTVFASTLNIVSTSSVMVRLGGAGGDIVDAVTNKPILLTNVVMGCLPPPTNSVQGRSMECLDPRFNWDGNTNWIYTSVPSTGRINQCAIDYWNNNPDCDRGNAFYVANRPLLSVGELGYLAVAPWRTVSIRNSSCLLDVFCVRTNAADDVRSRMGMVNPNSESLDALAVAFVGMPIDQYPGETPPAGGTLGFADAQLLASYVMAAQPLTNTSDITRVDWDALFADPSFSVSGYMTNEAIRESFVRNSIGLLSTRQNVFTIILAAELAGENNNFPVRPIRHRAVAIVWRDPFTNRFFLRSIKMLKD